MRTYICVCVEIYICVCMCVYAIPWRDDLQKRLIDLSKCGVFMCVCVCVCVCDFMA
jgi:hypothetical protein